MEVYKPLSTVSALINKRIKGVFGRYSHRLRDLLGINTSSFSTLFSFFNYYRNFYILPPFHNIYLPIFISTSVIPITSVAAEMACTLPPIRGNDLASNGDDMGGNSGKDGRKGAKM